MEQEEGQEPTNESTQEQQPAPTPPPAPTPQPQPQPKPQEGEDDLPAWAMQQRKDLRNEAANYRTQLREEQTKWDGGLTKSEAEALRTQLRELEARDVARETGLPLEFAPRLNGSTAEEMKADAEKLLESMPSGGARRLSGGLNPSTSGGSDESTEDRVKRLRQRRY